MNQETLDEYLKRANTKFTQDDMKRYVARHGVLNNVEYYVESMRRYFHPDLSLDGELIVQGVNDDGFINL